MVKPFLERCIGGGTNGDELPVLDIFCRTLGLNPLPLESGVPFSILVSYYDVQPQLGDMLCICWCNFKLYYLRDGLFAVAWSHPLSFDLSFFEDLKGAFLCVVCCRCRQSSGCASCFTVISFYQVHTSLCLTSNGLQLWKIWKGLSFLILLAIYEPWSELRVWFCVWCQNSSVFSIFSLRFWAMQLCQWHPNSHQAQTKTFSFHLFFLLLNPSSPNTKHP